MSDLPFEVYYGIFHHLSRPEIQICSFVCRRWNDVAVRVYNRELIIDDYKVQLAKINLSNGNADTYFKNGHLVRKVVFKSKYRGDNMVWFPVEDDKKRRSSFNKTEFLLLLKYLPNIKEIDLTKSGEFENYIYFLPYANLQHVKKITALPYEWSYGLSNFFDYFFTCFRYRDTLTSLYLEYTKESKDYTCGDMGILDILRQFKNLKQLILYNCYGSNLIMFQILELFPQLTELRFTDVCISKRDEEGHLDQRIEPTAKLNKSLQRLHINLKSLSIDYIKYLTSYLAEGLHTVNIQVKSSGLFHWIEEFGIEDVLRLMRKLGQQNHACILFPTSHASQRSGRFYEFTMEKWFQVVNAFRGDKKALCTVKFSESFSSQEYFEYSSSDNQLAFAHAIKKADYYESRNADYYESRNADYVEIGSVVYNEREDMNFYGLENGDYDEIENEIYFNLEDIYYYRRRANYQNYRSYNSSSNYSLPGGSTSTIGPEIIDRLELNLGQVSDNRVMESLRYVFKNCINLQYFKLTNYFQIQGCSNQKNRELNDIQNNLKMVHFINITPSNSILNIIFKYLPDIEVLVLGSRNKYNSSLDLRLFKSLKRCYIIIQPICNYNCEALNIKFEYMDGKKQWYYYDGTVKKTLVRADRQLTINLCRSLTFTCKNGIEFVVCFGCDESLLNFDINKHHDSRYHIPISFI